MGVGEDGKVGVHGDVTVDRSGSGMMIVVTVRLAGINESPEFVVP